MNNQTGSMENMGTNSELAQRAAVTRDPGEQEMLSQHPSFIIRQALLSNPNLAENLRPGIEKAIQRTNEDAMNAIRD